MDFKYIIYMIKKLNECDNEEWVNEVINDLLNEIYNSGYCDGCEGFKVDENDMREIRDFPPSCDFKIPNENKNSP